MPMTTDVCAKHGAYYAEKCPNCVYEDYKNMSEESKKFFEEHKAGEVRIRSEDKENWNWVPVEQLYQHFRIRLLEELDPILSKMSQTSRDQFEAAYYAAARR